MWVLICKIESMKKRINTIALALFVTAGASAQTVYDAVKIADKDLNGTARFVGMGGAMGALGGDISTIGTNPAGIGIYRSNDIMTSFSFSKVGTESSYGGSTFNRDNSRWSYDNVGFVLSTKIGNQTPLRYVNFGFNYHRSKSLFKDMSMEGLGNLGTGGAILSQTNQMADQANYMNGDISQISPRPDMKGNIFDDNSIGWLGAVGWRGYLYNHVNNENGGYYEGYLPQPYAIFSSRERGGVDQYDFNVAFNINDRVYLGFTVGAYNVNYAKSVTYTENFGDYTQNGENYGAVGYDMTTDRRIDGAGFDLKFGAIIRPFEYSPLRIGLSVHTPTFYNLTYKTNVRAVTDTFSEDGKDGPGIYREIVDSYDYLNNNDLIYDFRLSTPWKYNVSLGYTVGSSLAIGAEYEYEDYSTMKFRYPEGDAMTWENGEAKLNLQGEHTFRVGAEYKVIPAFALRAGYNYNSAIFKSDAIKALTPNSVATDTDFANTKSRNNYTLGIGYRGSLFYADLAYQFTTYKEDFYLFQNEITSSAGTQIERPDATSVTNTRSQVLLTLGVRF